MSLSYKASAATFEKIANCGLLAGQRRSLALIIVKYCIEFDNPPFTTNEVIDWAWKNKRAIPETKDFRDKLFMNKITNFLRAQEFIVQVDIVNCPVTGNPSVLYQLNDPSKVIKYEKDPSNEQLLRRLTNLTSDLVNTRSEDKKRLLVGEVKKEVKLIQEVLSRKDLEREKRKKARAQLTLFGG